MKNILSSILQYPYKALWSAALPVFIIGFLLKNRTRDIQLHDTYLVIDLCTVGILMSLYLLLIGLLYFLFRNKRLDVNLTFVHLLSIVLILAIWFGSSRIYPDPSPNNLESFLRNVNFVVLSTMIFVGVQLLFLVNLVFSFFRK